MGKSITLYDKSPAATSPDIEAPDIAEVTLNEAVVDRIKQAWDLLNEFPAVEIVLYEMSPVTKFGVVARWGDHVRHDGRAYDPWEEGAFSADFEGAWIKIRRRGDAFVEIRDCDTSGEIVSVVSASLGRVEDLVAKMAAAPEPKNSSPRMGM